MKKRVMVWILAAVMLLCWLSPVTVMATDTEEYRLPLSEGVQNIVKRARQMTEIQWSPVSNITGWNGEVIYYFGTTYTGLPYGQPVKASYVPWVTDLNGFAAAVNDPNSKMYTSYSAYNKIAPYYSTDCSAFVSWAWGLDRRWTAGAIPAFGDEISRTTYEQAQVGDCICLTTTHVVLITDVTYNKDGQISSIEISESTTDPLFNHCCKKTRYGTGGTLPLDELIKKYFENKYVLYRCKTRDSVTYTHSCAVPLEGDDCDKCKNKVNMYRMYDPHSGEHFYTGSTQERSDLVAAGWLYEGVGFTFPVNTGKPVYRMYNPVYGEHLYTMNEDEKAGLMAMGWNYEGIAFNSAAETEVPQFRLYNPNEKRGAYHFTASVQERDYLISLGWEYHGVGWYSCWS